MVRIITVAVLAAGAAALPNLRDRAHYEGKFVQWLKEHRVALSSSAEFSRRLAIFAAVDDRIEAHNAKNAGFTLGHNEYSIYTDEEFREMMGLNKPLPEQPKPDFLHLKQDTQNVAASVDWVAKGAVTPVKNQGSCGSCWAFATTGVLEGAYKIKYGSLPNLSEQHLVSCDTYDNGCNGGWMSTTFSWVRDNGGICSTSSYPYTSGSGQKGTCQSCSVVSGTRVSSIYNVADSEFALQTAVAQQPVAVAIDAGSFEFRYYVEGVFTGDCSTYVNHGVLAVGYGTDGLDYWKVKNSWGAGWGEGGYIRMHRNTGTPGGKCGITTGASYATF